MRTANTTRRRPAVAAVALALCGILVLPPAAGAQASVVEYYHVEGLGTVRAVSDAAGTLIPTETRDYLPFGEEWCGTGPCAPVPLGQPRRLTGKERDPETGLDYFGARYYGARIARFTTVDPFMNLPANLENPQAWNRYSYVLNNPLRYTDPDGRCTDVATCTRDLAQVGSGAGPYGRAAGLVLGVLVGAAMVVRINPEHVRPVHGGPLTVLDYQMQTGSFSKKAKSDEEIRYDKFVEDDARKKVQKNAAKDELKKSPNQEDAEATAESMRKTQAGQQKGGTRKIDGMGKAEQREKQSRPKSSDEIKEE